MIKNSTIQLYLRNILIDGLASSGIDIPILYENIKNKNLKDSYIVEHLFPLSETAINECVEWGEGLYKITVFDVVGSGLKFTDIVDTIANFFDNGVHVVDEEENIKLDIQEVSVTETLYKSNSDKIQKSVSVSYRKHKS